LTRTTSPTLTVLKAKARRLALHQVVQKVDAGAIVAEIAVDVDVRAGAAAVIAEGAVPAAVAEVTAEAAVADGGRLVCSRRFTNLKGPHRRPFFIENFY
jgi:hypothetical protein